jgi:23S rRNA U2552 (ribose-2'-O)-methylase RlmE/FtsJ
MMNKYLLLLLTVLFSAANSFGQIRLSSIKVDEWVKKNFSGQGIVVGNIKFKGYPLSTLSYTSTGNILKVENQQFFIDYCTSSKYGGKVHLFTADGGFDFSCNYENQEQLIFPLLLASSKIGLEVLRPGGVFVLKLFDFYYKSTLDLIYFLSLHFQEWTLYKPSMSRPCNPEQYFIGKGFLGCSDEVMDVMRVWCSMIDNKQHVDMLCKTDYPREFKKIIEELRHQSFQSQIEYLERVFFLIDQNDETLVQKFLKKNEKTSYEWCQRFHVPIASNRFPLTEVSHSDPPASVQQ